MTVISLLLQNCENPNVEAVILSIDGLQPEKGHETLSVVRELERVVYL